MRYLWCWKKGHAWRTISPEIKEKTSINLKLSLDENQSLAGTLRLASTGYKAYEKRKNYQDIGNEKFIVENAYGNPWETDSSKIINATPSELPFVESHTGRMHGAVIASGDKIYITPTFANAGEKSGWPDVQRRYPIDLVVPIEKTLLCSIAIPEDYTVESLPASIMHSMPDKSLSFSYKLTSNEKTIVITSNFIVKNTWFEPESYATVRNFYAMTLSKFNEPIVLVKLKK